MPHFLRFAALLGGLALGCANLAQAGTWTPRATAIH